MEAAYVTKCQWERGPCGTIDFCGKLDFHNIRGLHSPSVRLKNKAEIPTFDIERPQCGGGFGSKRDRRSSMKKIEPAKVW